MRKKSLLSLYNQELMEIKQQAKQFSEKNPRIANHLNLFNQSNVDPMIEHLFESFSFISARIQAQIEDENETFVQHLLQRFYPMFLRPQPSASIISINVDKETTDTVKIPKGSVVSCETKNQRIKFLTIYDTILQPFHIKDISYTKFRTNDMDGNGCISIDLTINEDVNLKEFTCQSVRLYINSAKQFTPLIHEILLNDTSSLSITQDTGVTKLPNALIKPVGLNDDQLLSHNKNIITSDKQLLFEYFHFPEKFQFIDIQFNEAIRFEDKKFSIVIQINNQYNELATIINRDIFSLHCTPILNTYNTLAEPIKIQNDDLGFEVKLEPYSPGHFTAIHNIKSVYLIDEQNKNHKITPYLSALKSSNDKQLYWYEQRTLSDPSDPNSIQKVILFLVDQEGNSISPVNSTLHIEVIATNNNMPCRLSITEDRLTFWDNNQNWNYSITTLTSFTRTNYLYNNQLSPWLLVRNLNHQSSALCDENELLWLHNILDMQSTSNYKHNDIIRKSINTISTKNILKRYNHANITNYICGTEVTISINNDYCNHADMYLFFLILSRYWQDQCAINSFIETRVVDSNDTCIYVFNDCNGKRGLV